MFSLEILPSEIATIPFPFIVGEGLFIISKNKVLHPSVSTTDTTVCSKQDQGEPWYSRL